MQIKLSTKSSLKELAASINKYVKVKNQVVKDELQNISKSFGRKTLNHEESKTLWKETNIMLSCVSIF